MERFMKRFKYDEVIEIDGQKLSKQYIASLNKKEREDLIEPIFQYLRFQGFAYPDDISKIDKEWKRLLDCDVDLDSKELYNNSSVATYICKFFCKSFYEAKHKPGKPNMVELFEDDEILKKLIWNRLGLAWYTEEEKNEVFWLRPKMFVQGFRSMRLAGMISMFKPEIAKYLTLKYSQPGEIIYDPSSGWGSRMLGAAAVNRKYIGVDPLTTPELKQMAKYLKLKGCALIQEGSENYKTKENSVDFVMTSPPYFDTEIYSEDPSQAYINGEDYFYDVYWKNTLDNIKYMLKPGKIFALNVINYPKIIKMATDKFEQVDEIQLRTVRSHLNKSSAADAQKYEPIHILKND